MTKIKEKLLVASQDEDALKVLEKFGITSEIIEGYQELEKPATLDEAIKNFNLQSDLDKKLDKALRTREENLKAKYNFVEKEQPKDDGKDPKTDNPELSALLQKFADLEKKFEQQEEEKQKLTFQQKKDKFEELLKSKNIPTIYGAKFDPEKDLDEQATIVQEEFEKDFGAIPKPKGGIRLPQPNRSDDNKPSKKDIEEFKRKMR